MLNKGGGMSDLAKEAEKYGLVLTDKNMDAVKATEAHRQQEAAMQGVAGPDRHARPADPDQVHDVRGDADPEGNQVVQRPSVGCEEAGVRRWRRAGGRVPRVGGFGCVVAAATLAATWPIPLCSLRLAAGGWPDLRLQALGLVPRRPLTPP